LTTKPFPLLARTYRKTLLRFNAAVYACFLPAIPKEVPKVKTRFLVGSAALRLGMRPYRTRDDLCRGTLAARSAIGVDEESPNRRLASWRYP